MFPIFLNFICFLGGYASVPVLGIFKLYGSITGIALKHRLCCFHGKLWLSRHLHLLTALELRATIRVHSLANRLCIPCVLLRAATADAAYMHSKLLKELRGVRLHISSCVTQRSEHNRRSLCENGPHEHDDIRFQHFLSPSPSGSTRLCLSPFGSLSPCLFSSFFSAYPSRCLCLRK